MKYVWTLSAALVFACACASSPPEPKPMAVAAAKPAAAAPQKASASNPDRVICKTDKVLGHHTPVETCRTKAQWDSLRADRTQSVKDAERDVQAAAGLSNPDADERNVTPPN